MKKSKGKSQGDVREESSDPRWELLEGAGPMPWECCIPFPLSTRKNRGRSGGRTGRANPRLTLIKGGVKERSRREASGHSDSKPDHSA